uniref:ORF78 n=1 Tax=Malaco herpesvirus 4 TaxID=3031800 RepID=A0AA48SFG4_9VIRU|nr:TPA_asm: ORF78 [Malaco herpesvirus 4]
MKSVAPHTPDNAKMKHVEVEHQTTTTPMALSLKHPSTQKIKNNAGSSLLRDDRQNTRKSPRPLCSTVHVNDNNKGRLCAEPVKAHKNNKKRDRTSSDMDGGHHKSKKMKTTRLPFISNEKERSKLKPYYIQLDKLIKRTTKSKKNLHQIELLKSLKHALEKGNVEYLPPVFMIESADEQQMVKWHNLFSLLVTQSQNTKLKHTIDVREYIMDPLKPLAKKDGRVSKTRPCRPVMIVFQNATGVVNETRLTMIRNLIGKHSAFCAVVCFSTVYDVKQNNPKQGRQYMLETMPVGMELFTGKEHKKIPDPSGLDIPTTLLDLMRRMEKMEKQQITL